MIRSSSFSRIVCVSVVSMLVPAAAIADINGFGGLSPSLWSYNQGDSNGPPVINGPDDIEFTTGVANQRSAWFRTTQNIDGFQCTFTYRGQQLVGSSEAGIAFCVQSQGLTALGAARGGGYEGITPSVAISIQNSVAAAPDQSFTNFGSNGVIGSGAVAMLPVNTFTGEAINVTITYAAPTLSVSMVQGANVFPTRNYNVGSLAAQLGSTSAYVGFTSGAFATIGGAAGGRQFLSNLVFRSTGAGACCTGAACALVTPTACSANFRGSGTVCGTPGNPVACCRANVNGVGGLTVQDVFDFLTAWFSGDAARANFNGDCCVSTQDIFDFLAAWFQGC